MNEEFLVVWRSSEGAAVQTYAQPDKSPKVFKDKLCPEAAQADWVDADTFGILLENREAFHPKCVGKETARELLGWPV